jgi:hypothetical protein
VSTISVSKASQQFSAVVTPGDVLAFWVRDDRQADVFLGAGASDVEALSDATAEMNSEGIDMEGGSIEYMTVVADE